MKIHKGKCGNRFSADCGRVYMDLNCTQLECNKISICCSSCVDALEKAIKDFRAEQNADE